MSAYSVTIRWTGSPGRNQGSQCSGAEVPQSPSVEARAAMPSRNASGNEFALESGMPRACQAGECDSQIEAHVRRMIAPVRRRK